MLAAVVRVLLSACPGMPGEGNHIGCTFRAILLRFCWEGHSRDLRCSYSRAPPGKIPGGMDEHPAMTSGCACAHEGSDLDAVATLKPQRESERERERELID